MQISPRPLSHFPCVVSEASSATLVEKVHPCVVRRCSYITIVWCGNSKWMTKKWECMANFKWWCNFVDINTDILHKLLRTSAQLSDHTTPPTPTPALPSTMPFSLQQNEGYFIYTRCYCHCPAGWRTNSQHCSCSNDRLEAVWSNCAKSRVHVRWAANCTACSVSASPPPPSLPTPASLVLYDLKDHGAFL